MEGGVRGHPIHVPDGFHRSQDDVSELLDAVQNMLLVETHKFSGVVTFPRIIGNHIDDFANLTFTVFDIIDFGIGFCESVVFL